jgi:threonine/homoserine/homoserine lactone efflux protein
VDVAALSAARLTGRGRRGAFAIGLLTNLSNPKAAVFTFAFYPAFIPRSYPLLPTAAGLELVQISLDLLLYSAFALMVARSRDWFLRDRIRRRLEALSGGVLIALGLHIAAESR